jgi:hypothetical protein
MLVSARLLGKRRFLFPKSNPDVISKTWRRKHATGKSTRYDKEKPTGMNGKEGRATAFDPG